MKKIILLFSLLISSQLMMAQCTPDPSVITWGLHPLPSVGLDGLAAVPEVPACIGEDYEYTFSFVVPSSFELPGGAGNLGVTSATITGVTGLPSGLTYGECAPGSCVIPGGTTGCFNIYGTPDASNTPGSFEIEITVTVAGTVVVLPQSVDLTFPPDPTFNLFDFPLDPYAIDLRAANQCTNSNSNLLEKELTVGTNAPNPFSEVTTIEIESQKSGNYTFTVTNLLGEKISEKEYTFSTGTNIIEYNASELSNGIYIYSISNELGNISNKMIVSK